jgi:hypothetical protein
MIPFIADPTVLVADQVPLPNVTPTLAQVNIGGIPATVSESAIHLNPLDWSPITLANGTIGLPLWLFISAGFVLMFLYVLLSWIFKLRRMNAVKGYVTAADKGTQEDLQTWIFGKTKKLTIECLKYWGSMVHFPANVKITKWMHRSIFATITLGGQNAVMVSDDFDTTRDPVSEIALCEACEIFNNNQEELEKYKREHKFDSLVVKPISSFSDYRSYGRKVLEQLYPDGLPIPSYSFFNHTKFRKYFPKGRDGDLQGGIFLRKSRRLRERLKDEGIWGKVLPLGITVVFVGIVIFAAMYAPIGFGK